MSVPHWIGFIPRTGYRIFPIDALNGFRPARQSPVPLVYRVTQTGDTRVTRNGDTRYVRT